jgi:hypothetical protein
MQGPIQSAKFKHSRQQAQNQCIDFGHFLGKSTFSRWQRVSKATDHFHGKSTVSSFCLELLPCYIAQNVLIVELAWLNRLDLEVLVFFMVNLKTSLLFSQFWII